MRYNPGRHHRRSVRLRGYDYSQEGIYFITVCVKNMVCSFGDVQDGKMVLNETGKLAEQFLLDMNRHFPVALIEEFIVMPNHIHLILILNREGERPEPTVSQFGQPVGGSVSVIIDQYKSSVKRWCNNNGHSNFEWQTRFYDHIIRNEMSHQRIVEYIRQNPQKWDNDKFRPSS